MSHLTYPALRLLVTLSLLLVWVGVTHAYSCLTSHTQLCTVFCGATAGVGGCDACILMSHLTYPALRLLVTLSLLSVWVGVTHAYTALTSQPSSAPPRDSISTVSVGGCDARILMSHLTYPALRLLVTLSLLSVWVGVMQAYSCLTSHTQVYASSEIQQA